MSLVMVIAVANLGLLKGGFKKVGSISERKFLGEITPTRCQITPIFAISRMHTIYYNMLLFCVCVCVCVCSVCHFLSSRKRDVLAPHRTTFTNVESFAWRVTMTASQVDPTHGFERESL